MPVYEINMLFKYVRWHFTQEFSQLKGLVHLQVLGSTTVAPEEAACDLINHLQWCHSVASWVT